MYVCMYMCVCVCVCARACFRLHADVQCVCIHCQTVCIYTCAYYRPMGGSFCSSFGFSYAQQISVTVCHSHVVRLVFSVTNITHFRYLDGRNYQLIKQRENKQLT
jgi:hypothetical protein